MVMNADNVDHLALAIVCLCVVIIIAMFVLLCAVWAWALEMRNGSSLISALFFSFLLLCTVVLMRQVIQHEWYGATKNAFVADP